MRRYFLFARVSRGAVKIGLEGCQTICADQTTKAPQNLNVASSKKAPANRKPPVLICWSLSHTEDFSHANVNVCQGVARSSAGACRAPTAKKPPAERGIPIAIQLLPSRQHFPHETFVVVTSTKASHPGGRGLVAGVFSRRESPIYLAVRIWLGSHTSTRPFKTLGDRVRFWIVPKFPVLG